MLDLTKETAAWPKDDDGWSVSPGTIWCPAGRRVRVGQGCAAGNGFKAGDYFKAGNYAAGIACIGYADGYWKSLSAVDGVAYIGAGCRWFPLADAIRHWSNHAQDRRATLALMQAAKALAEIHGLKEE